MMGKFSLQSFATKKRMFWLSSCAALMVGGQSAAVAQTPPAASASDNVSLEEIIVTAQKRSENLQDVPVAVSAFTSETLKAANVTGIADLVNITPSLRFSYAAASGAPFLRGVGTDQTFPGAEAEVQTYIDNVYYGSGGAAFTRFNNIARVEVDKGPQGTLFGRNATGGVIQIFTKDPSHNAQVDASVGYGNYNMKEVDFYATGGLSDNLAADIAVRYEDRDGWGRNVTLNRDAFTLNSIGIRSKWLLEASDSTRITLIGDYSRNKSDIGTAFVVVGGFWQQTPSATPPTYLGDFKTAGDKYSRGDVTQYGASLKLETKLSDLSFVSISAYRYTDSKGYVDADATASPTLSGDDLRTEEQFSQEFQLLSPSNSRLQWILGAYLYYNKAKAVPARLSGLAFAFTGANSLDFFSSMTTKSIAGFGQFTYDLTDNTHITGGLRYTHDNRDQTASSVFNYPTGPGAPPPFLGLGVNNFPNAKFSAVTGKFTIAHDFSDDVMGYIGYSRGFKSGTFNNLIVLRNPEPALQPEYMDAFEGGLKSDLFDGRVRLNLAAFLYKYRNLQVNVFENFNVALRNAANSEIRGIDGDFQIAVAKNTRITGGAAYLDAKYKKFDNAPLYAINPITNLNPANFGFGGVLIGTLPAPGAAGKRLPQAPEFSANIGISQKVETSAGNLDLNAGVSYQTRIFFTPDNLYSQSPYANVSASAKWTSRDGKWDVTLWGRNLTDIHTYGTLSVSGFLVAGIPNEPRSFGARLGVHF